MFQSLSVKVCICTSISWYFQKIYKICISRAGEKIPSPISLYFRKVTAKVSRNNSQMTLGLNIPFPYFRHFRFSWVEAYQILCLSSFQCTPNQNNRLGKKCVRKKDLLKSRVVISNESLGTHHCSRFFNFNPYLWVKGHKKYPFSLTFWKSPTLFTDFPEMVSIIPDGQQATQQVLGRALMEFREQSPQNL